VTVSTGGSTTSRGEAQPNMARYPKTAVKSKRLAVFIRSLSRQRDFAHTHRCIQEGSMIAMDTTSGGSSSHSASSASLSAVSLMSSSSASSSTSNSTGHRQGFWSKTHKMRLTGVLQGFATPLGLRQRFVHDPHPAHSTDITGAEVLTKPFVPSLV
jgi:hypothetical protein